MGIRLGKEKRMEKGRSPGLELVAFELRRVCGYDMICNIYIYIFYIYICHVYSIMHLHHLQYPVTRSFRTPIAYASHCRHELRNRWSLPCMAGHKTYSSWSKGKLWSVCNVECSAWLTVGMPSQSITQPEPWPIHIPHDCKKWRLKRKVWTATAFSTAVSGGAGEARSDCQAASWRGGTCNQCCHFMLVVWGKAGKMVLWEHS